MQEGRDAAFARPFPQQIARVVSESREGAVIKVERIELTDAGKRSVTTSAEKMGTGTCGTSGDVKADG